MENADVAATGAPLTVARLGMLLFATFTAAMLGLAAGAVWMVPALYLQRPLPWLAPAVGLLLGLAVRHWIHPARRLASGWAVMAMLLAALYQQALVASARIAGALGIGLLEAMREAGPAMLLDLLRLSLRPADLLWAFAGAALAGWIAGRRRVSPPAP